LAEYLDLRRDDGTLTGVVKCRTLVHRDGDLHGTAHVWIARPCSSGFALLLQKRSAEKDAYPDCWDISSAGHLPAGSDFLESARRELHEELGLIAAPEALHFVGFRHRIAREVFHGAPFVDNEYSAVYLLPCSVEPDELHLQKEEVSEVRYFPFDAILDRFHDPSFRHCLYLDELRMVERAYTNLKRSSL